MNNKYYEICPKCGANNRYIFIMYENDDYVNLVCKICENIFKIRK